MQESNNVSVLLAYVQERNRIFELLCAGNQQF